MEKLWLVVANHTDARILAHDRSGCFGDFEVFSDESRKRVVEECPKNIVSQDVTTIVEALSFPLQTALKSAAR